MSIEIKNTNRILLILLLGMISIFTAAIRPAAADMTMNAAEFDSLSAAAAAIPDGAGMVTLLLSDKPEWPDEDDLVIPADRGITGLEILLPENTEKMPPLNIGRICANGIPLTVGYGIDLPETSIYGGACVSGTESRLESSSLRINGAVGFVFGGGFAENGGTAIVTHPSVSVDYGGLVYYEVFGGGHAYGPGSAVSSEKTSVTVLGTTDYVLGAGFAEDGGRSECGETAVTVGENASVEVALFAGGSAAGEDSRSTTNSPFAQLSGFAGWAFSGDFAFGGGKTETSGSGRLEILPTGSTNNAFLGSFASDAGSIALINTAELMNCGTAELVTERSQSSDGGEAKTQITANFPCSLIN